MAQITAVQEKEKRGESSRISFREGFRRLYEAALYGIFVLAIGAGIAAILPANQDLIPLGAAVAVAAGAAFTGKLIAGPSN